MAETRTPPASILFPPTGAGAGTKLAPTEPDWFADLNLDQLVADITAGRDEYNLKPYFYTPLTSSAAVEFRHAVIRDLRSENVAELLPKFADGMRVMRMLLAEGDKLRYRQQQRRVFLDAAIQYVRTVGGLAAGLMSADLASAGMLGFRDRLDRYVASEAFSTLAEDADRVADELELVEYEFLIHGNRISVFRLTGETDYSAAVADTFAKFQQGTVKPQLENYPERDAMDHVEAGIVDLVAGVFPDQFNALERFAEKHYAFQSATLARFDQEAQFYRAYDEYLAKATGTTVSTCLPMVTSARTSSATAAVDLVLAAKLTGGARRVVGNDFFLTGDERILVVTGANQGGKTTFARAFGQLHYLAALGLPVAASSATLHLFDRMFTHFERQEDLQNLTGKLEDDLMRVHAILDQATGDSIVIMNEIFTSTTLNDAIFLGTQILERIIERGAIGVCVTFVDELSTLGPATVSMVADVDPSDVATRTFHISRRPADGLAHATAIADRYGLSSTHLQKRIYA